MTLLHDYLNTRNLQGFQRLLDRSSERTAGAAPSSAGAQPSSWTGASKSWTRNGGVDVVVNARDWLGRTALHLACNSVDNIEYVRALLKHPNVDVNLQDTESSWTPLHRALYSANLPVALLLLQRADTDTALKDSEGYTAFDLYNSTVNGTKPDAGDPKAELFTWGANRNAALGVSDAGDRTFPDHVTIKSKEDSNILANADLATRLFPIYVRQIQMSKLHTVVVTTEKEGNLRLCGFGSGGRLGPAQHTQYTFKPLTSMTLEIMSVALGQDHTLALTKSGEVYSWGLNRFAQLGYIVESNTTTGRHEEPIQSVPKRVVGLLRKEVVRGVAASKNASACWTKDAVFTWGTNTGQLGYDKNAQPVQISPRPVTKFSNEVIDLAMSETVLVALLVTRHVECIWNDRHYRISFPMHAFPSGIEPYRPPQSIKDSRISKITCCDDSFAALSLNGEVFTFSAPRGNADATSSEGRAFTPQRVWALRKKFSAVKDVALGSDGSIIICTESGHVFVRTRNVKNASGKAFKFERVPFLQRVTQVCANSTGAYGALRVDYTPRPIEVKGNTIAQDLKEIQPYMAFYREGGEKGALCNDGTTVRRTRARSIGAPELSHVDDEDLDDDTGIERDILGVRAMYQVLACERRVRTAHGGAVKFDGMRLPHGADAVVHLQPSGAAFPVHRVILAARSPVLARMLADPRVVVRDEAGLRLSVLSPAPAAGLGVWSIARLSVGGCHAMSLLIFLHYLYSDELLALWDRRVESALEALGSRHGDSEVVVSAVVKTQLQALARVLDLPALAQALEGPVKRDPVSSMAKDMQRLFDAAQGTTFSTDCLDAMKSSSAAASMPSSLALAPDVVLQLEDRDVYCHSAILRARSPLFASFFDLEDWTRKRWDKDGMVRVNMRHLKWHAMRFVLSFMCGGADGEMFRVLDFVDSVEDLIQFMFDVLAGANELHLDRLVLICSSVILSHSNITNACYVLSDATHYRVQPLIVKLQEYIAVNLESFLESRLLEEIPYALVKQLALYTRERQTEKSPFARGGAFVGALLEKHAAWLAMQDLPEPILRDATRKEKDKDLWSARISPPVSMATTQSRKASTSGRSQASRMVVLGSGTQTAPALRRPASGDDIFIMDDPETPSITTEAAPSINSATKAEGSGLAQASPVWKAHRAPKVDMKALMAEAASQKPVARQTSAQNLSQSSRTSGQVRAEASPSKGAGIAGWRVPADLAVSRGPILGTPAAPSSSKDVRSPASGARVVSGSRPPSAPATPVRNQPQSLGPVITPTRQTPTKSQSNVRNVSGGKAWTLPPVQPVAEPSRNATKGVSFVAIQHAQQEQAAPPVRDKRSLREIQEEEHALQAEADFLKWWTAEEERVRLEEDATLNAQLAASVKPRKKDRRKNR